jgi:hypothetical protein
MGKLLFFFWQFTRRLLHLRYDLTAHIILKPPVKVPDARDHMVSFHGIRRLFWTKSAPSYTIIHKYVLSQKECRFFALLSQANTALRCEYGVHMIMNSTYFSDSRAWDPGVPNTSRCNYFDVTVRLEAYTRDDKMWHLALEIKKNGIEQGQESSGIER